MNTPNGIISVMTTSEMPDSTMQATYSPSIARRYCSLALLTATLRMRNGARRDRGARRRQDDATIRWSLRSA
jgi:hypothetical protein